MKPKPFDFSKNIEFIDLYQRICFYYNAARSNLGIIKENKKLALANFSEIYHLLENEFIEYSKVRNYKFISTNVEYISYVDNIKNAYSKPTRVRSYDNLSSNLYDIKYYILNNFNSIFCLNDNDNFEKSNIDSYLGKVCCIELNNYELYVGKVDLKLYEIPNENVESISILYFEQWKQIYIEEIKRIRVIE